MQKKIILGEVRFNPCEVRLIIKNLENSKYQGVNNHIGGSSPHIKSPYVRSPYVG